MKIKKDKKKILLKEPKDSWAKKISDYLKKQNIGLPIVSRFEKGDEKTGIHFSVYNRIIRIGQLLKDRTKRFKTMNDVHRAGHYIGVMLLYQIYYGEINNGIPVDADLHKMIKVREKHLYMLDRLEGALNSADILNKSYLAGLITEQQFNDGIEEFECYLPNNISKAFCEKIKQLKAGEKVSSLVDFKTGWGGKREGSGRPNGSPNRKK